MAAVTLKNQESLLSRANDMWHDKKPLQEIAVAYDLQAYDMLQLIEHARKTLGGTWFPVRRPPTGEITTQAASAVTI